MLFSLIYIVLPRAGGFVFDSTVTSAVVRSLFHLLLCKLSPGLACTRQLELLSCAACVWWMGPHGHTILWPLPYLASCLALGLALTNLSTEGALSACVTLSESPAWPTPSHQQLDSSPLDCLSLSLGPKFPSNENSIHLKASPRTSHPTGRPEEREEKRPQFLEVRHASHPSQVRSSPRQRASGMGGGREWLCSAQFWALLLQRVL